MNGNTTGDLIKDTWLGSMGVYNGSFANALALEDRARRLKAEQAAIRVAPARLETPETMPFHFPPARPVINSAPSNPQTYKWVECAIDLEDKAKLVFWGFIAGIVFCVLF
ncbi:MAG: hypothetical protein APF80_15875 [Alphaproteobacteria bacterium BRH_c36]|nr:MAG: hypothetical protein APF80_15875 [Alphaproteobacteria bacterium BRH_c36]